ncbi:MAG: SCO family protein [Bdellovibrionota bacterium]
MKRLLLVASALLFCARIVSAQDHIHGTELEPSESTPDSIYQVDSQWTASDGRQLRLSELAGKPRLIALFYASCASACPAIVDAMQRVERDIQAGDELGFILVTFDTDEDTPAVLAQYAAKRRLDRTKWSLLRGGEDDTRELAVLLGSKYKKLAPRSFAHSNLIALLDKDGRIVARAKSLSDIPSFSSDVRAFLAASVAK